MTFEELKAAADELGYSLIKKRYTENFLPCTCGHNRRSHVYSYTHGEYCHTLQCKNCGRSVTGSSDSDARIKWNNIIREETR